MPTDKCLIKMKINKQFFELCWKARGPLPAQQNANMWEANAHTPGVFEMPGLSWTTEDLQEVWNLFILILPKKRGIWLAAAPDTLLRTWPTELKRINVYRLTLTFICLGFFSPFSLSRQTWNCRQVMLCGVSPVMGCQALQTCHKQQILGDIILINHLNSSPITKACARMFIRLVPSLSGLACLSVSLIR